MSTYYQPQQPPQPQQWPPQQWPPPGQQKRGWETSDKLGLITIIVSVLATVLVPLVIHFYPADPPSSASPAASSSPTPTLAPSHQASEPASDDPTQDQTENPSGEDSTSPSHKPDTSPSPVWLTDLNWHEDSIEVAVGLNKMKGKRYPHSFTVTGTSMYGQAIVPLESQSFTKLTGTVGWDESLSTYGRKGFEVGVYVTTGSNFSWRSDEWVRLEVVTIGSRDNPKRVSVDLPPGVTGVRLIREEPRNIHTDDYILGDFKVS